MSSKQAMIDAAIATLGVGETDGDNTNYITDWYGENGAPWCAMAVTYWAWHSGNYDNVCFGEHHDYTVEFANAFSGHGQWHTDVAGIQSGDVVFFDWDYSNSIGEIDHVGIVEFVDGEGVHTIEGNIGNVCARKLRDASTIVGYGRPVYDDDTTTPPPAGGGDGMATVKLADAQAHKAAATKVIQAALNRFKAPVTVDGDYGPKTKAAYKAWQQSLGWPGDGEPGRHSLWSLAKKYGFKTDITGTPAGPGGATPEPVTYTVKAGDSLSKIARDLSVDGGWEALYEANKALIGDDPGNIQIGQKLVVPEGAPVTPAPPPPPPPPASLPKEIDFDDVGPGGTDTGNRVLETALNKFRPPVTVDGDFGDADQAVYAAWQKYLGYTGSDADGIPGRTSLTQLGLKYGFRVTDPDAPPPPAPEPPAPAVSLSDYLTAPAPPEDYRRLTYGGRTVNRRTAVLLDRAAGWAHVTISLAQGSYNAGGVAASAGTHDGGGAVDINVGRWSANLRAEVVQCLRKAGFAAWLRGPDYGFAWHIHAVAIGDAEASSGAKRQMQSYFDHRNALADNAYDSTPLHYPDWCDRYVQ